MAERIDNDAGTCSEASARDGFTSEGGHVIREPAAGPERVDAALAERRRLMSEFSIRYDGRRYRWSGYRYDRLADAVAYARLLRSKQAQERPTASMPRGSAAIDLPSRLPSEADRQLMADVSVLFKAGVCVYRGFRYERLADAVSYARLCRRRQAAEGAK